MFNLLVFTCIQAWLVVVGKEAETVNADEGTAERLLLAVGLGLQATDAQATINRTFLGALHESGGEFRDDGLLFTSAVLAETEAAQVGMRRVVVADADTF